MQHALAQPLRLCRLVLPCPSPPMRRPLARSRLLQARRSPLTLAREPASSRCVTPVGTSWCSRPRAEAYGGAFTDAGGNTIISYQATQRQSQYDVAEDTLAGDDPSSLPAYSDALAFARQVVSLTASQGRSPKQVYLTGFSEGGILASFVAWHTGLPGVSFASCGLPGYSSSSAPVNNFISFLESGDPFAQYGTDTLEQASAVVASAKMDHYGIVLQLETSGNDIKLFAQTIAGHDLTQEEDGSLGLTQAQLDAVEDEANELFSQYHNLSLYSSDANTLAAEYGY